MAAREVYKGGWLQQRMRTKYKKTVYKDSQWFALCIHDEKLPFLEIYNDKRDVLGHQPVQVIDLIHVQHVSQTLQDERTFAVGLLDQSLELVALDEGEKNEWIDMLSGKLRDMGFINPDRNEYVSLPVAGRKDSDLPQRDPRDRLPAVPRGLPFAPVPAGAAEPMESASSTTNSERRNNGNNGGPPLSASTSNLQTTESIMTFVDLTRDDVEEELALTYEIPDLDARSPRGEKSRSFLMKKMRESSEERSLSSSPDPVADHHVGDVMTVSFRERKEDSGCFPTTSSGSDDVPPPLPPREPYRSAGHEGIEVTRISGDGLPIIYKRSSGEPPDMPAPPVPPRTYTSREAAYDFLPCTSTRQSNASSSGAPSAPTVSSPPPNGRPYDRLPPASPPPTPKHSVSPPRSSRKKNDNDTPPPTVPPPPPPKTKRIQQPSKIPVPRISPNASLNCSNGSSDGSQVSPPQLQEQGQPASGGASGSEAKMKVNKLKERFESMHTKSESFQSITTHNTTTTVHNATVLESKKRSIDSLLLTGGNTNESRLIEPPRIETSEAYDGFRPSHSPRSPPPPVLPPPRLDHHTAPARSQTPDEGKGTSPTPPLPPRSKPPPLTEARSLPLAGAPSGTNQAALGRATEYSSLKTSSNQPPRSGSVSDQVTLVEQTAAEFERQQAFAEGLKVRLTGIQAAGLALVEVGKRVWIAGWLRTQSSSLSKAFHVCDELIALDGQRLAGGLKEAERKLAACGMLDSDTIELQVRRVPLGTLTVLQRDDNQQDVGVVMDGAGNQVASIIPGSVADTTGLTARVPGFLSPDKSVQLYIAEVNGAPISFSAKHGEAAQQLRTVGQNVSILGVPSDFAKAVKKQLKGTRRKADYRQYLVGLGSVH